MAYVIKRENEEFYFCGFDKDAPVFCPEFTDDVNFFASASDAKVVNDAIFRANRDESLIIATKLIPVEWDAIIGINWEACLKEIINKIFQW